MKYAFYVLFSFFLVSTNIQANSGGTVYFGGYIYEESCLYQMKGKQLTSICRENGKNAHHSHTLNALGENLIAVNSIKLSGISLSKIDQNNAVATAFYL
ncbi:hypothetical protein [Providencia sp. Me31A]|uniref:hypothetical protein n=1 Tax=Providencia sp. Me31A TaxID=3392637 RepID=UPI003D267F35